MHQPPDILRLPMDRNPQGAEQIIRCYVRVPRHARKFKEHARIHVGFSGILLKQLRDPEIVDSYRSMLDIPAMLDSYAKADIIELMGMGYDHPLFPSFTTVPYGRKGFWIRQKRAGATGKPDRFTV
jgi:hypothetical protein